MLRHSSQQLPLRLSLGGAILCAVGVATLTELQPAAAASFMAGVHSLVTCATSGACVAGTNTSIGVGVSGTNTNNGVGVSGSSKNGFGVAATSNNADGIYATSGKGNGLFAYSAKAAGVNGSSAITYGVFGSTNGTGAAAGVFGEKPYVGVWGSPTLSVGTGVRGDTTSGAGVYGQATGGGDGVDAISQSGQGVYASSSSGTALEAYSASGIGVRSEIAGAGFSVVGTSINGQGSGADFEGGRFGIIGRAQPSGFPLVLTDSSYKNVFFVTGTEDVYSSGNYYTLARTAGGAISSYTAKLTQPTVEDTGSAQLTAGVATVTLDPSFAVATDESASYRVFVTPDGDTRGLFVSRKTPHGFVVRETQGGRSNLAFDYRIVATSRGGAGKRMTVIPLGVAPNAPAALPVKRPQIKVANPPATTSR